jgi:hypothetical protein
MFKAKNSGNLEIAKKVLKVLLWTILLFVLISFAQCSYELSYQIIFGKASYSTKATYKLPETDVEIVLERRAIHLFLAEYERTLILRVDGKEVLRQEAAGDSGGYCRMNVYQISPNEYFLSGDISHDKYELDVIRQKITSATLKEKPPDAKFVGAFDTDEKRHLRFIPATEREEQKNKIKHYGEI